MKTIIFRVEGMHCKSCEMLIGDELDELGVKNKINHEKGTAEIEFDENSISLEKIKKVIEGEGYKVK